jgi:hypothetical protein
MKPPILAQAEVDKGASVSELSEELGLQPF